MIRKSAGTRIPWTIALEKKTVAAMVSIYCLSVHPDEAAELCPSCAHLLKYAQKRLDGCVYGGAKPTCRECPVHCYRPDERDEMKRVMRFAGPKMIVRHPFLTLVHLWKEHSPFRNRPSQEKSGRRVRPS